MNRRSILVSVVSVALMFCANVQAQPTIETFAGTGTPGHNGDGQQATAAWVYNPQGMDMDAQGNLYLADQNNNRVRKIAPDGTITTLAGTGTLGYNQETQAHLAHLATPVDVHVGPDGSVYIADANNKMIRKVDTSGTISTVAGGGADNPGEGGLATDAYIGRVFGVAVDGAGNIYISTYDAASIRRVDAVTGIITTVVSGAEVNTPQKMDVDAAGNVYVAIQSRNFVQKVSPTGVLSRVAGTGNPGYSGDGLDATLATLNGPQGVTVAPNGDVYITDTNNQAIRKVDAVTGLISTWAGGNGIGFTGEDVELLNAKFNYPTGILYLPFGDIYISDHLNQRVRLVRLNDAPVADAGADQVIATAGGPVNVTLDGSSSSDADGTIVRYTWTEGATVLADGDAAVAQTPVVGLGAGQHTIQLEVEDDSGATDTDDVVIDVALVTPEIFVSHHTATYEQDVDIPVTIHEAAGTGLVSAEVFVSYDSAVLTPRSPVATVTALTVEWTLQANEEPGAGTLRTIKVAMADDQPLAASGVQDLLQLHFTVKDLREPAATALTLDHVLLNNGTPGHTTQDGSLTVTGTDGVLAGIVVESGSTTQVIPRETIQITVTDVDENRDDGQPDAIDVLVWTGADSETVTLTESGVATGEFVGAISTEFSLSGTAEDGMLQAQAGDVVQIDYTDLLDVTGVTVPRVVTINVVGGADGTLEASLVTQPGDGLRIKVVDADLNADDQTSEQALVVVTNTNTLEQEAFLLDEQGNDTDVFYGKLATTSGGTVTDNDGTLHSSKSDIIEVLYADDLTESGGAASLVAIHDVVNPFGDADGNGLVQAFDAAQVLQHALNPFLVHPALRAADVDQQAQTPLPLDVDEYDAALILQKRVGLITVFEVQEADAAQHPQPESTANPKSTRDDSRMLTLLSGDGYVAVWSPERSLIVSADLTMEGASGVALPGEDLGDFLIASRSTDDGLRVVMAGAQWVSGPGELVRIYPTETAESIRLAEVELNGGRLHAWHDAGNQLSRAPSAFALHANTPNPFNPETVIRFDLPKAAEVRLEVFDILGQRVRTLISQQLPAGSHQAVWDGRNTQAAAVGNGTYFYRLSTGDDTQMRSMLLLK